MARNEWVAASQEAARAAGVHAATAAEVFGGQTDGRSGAAAGATNGSGVWTPFGRLDLTTFGAGLALSGPWPAYGRLDFTTFSAGLKLS